MKRTLKLAVMLAVVSAFAVGCNKEEESPHSTMETPSAKVDETGGFHLGRKLDNPYSVANMLAAQDSLLNIGQLKESLDIHPTHLYVQLYPNDSADMNSILEDTTLHLFPYPLDYEIEGEGSFEVPEGVTPEIYTVVPVGYNIPIGYRVIEECFIPQNYNNPDYATLEIGSFVRNGNVTQSELQNLYSAKALWKRPQGNVKVYNTESGQNEGVRGVHVYTRKIVNVGCAYTDANGHYSIPNYYLFDPSYAVVFENSNGFKIWGNIGPLTPAIHNVGTHSKGGYDITIGTGSQAWPWATINNAALLYRTNFVPHFGVSNTPDNLRIWYINKSSNLGSASTPMLRHVAGYTFLQVATWLQIFGVCPTTSLIIGGAVYCALMFCPDILVMNNNASTTKQLQKTIFHEMAHASHYSKVGSAYWLNYIGQICLNLGYGNSSNGTNGIIGVGEMWGNYFGNKCVNYHYNTNYSYNYAFWFKPQILENIDDQLSDVGPMQINNVMGTSVTNHNSFKTALINQYGHNDVITQCFSEYGF